MIRLQRRAREAIRTSAVMFEYKRVPLLRCEGAFRSEPQRPVLLDLRAHDRWVRAVVFGDPLLQPLRVAGVVRRVLGPMGLGMTLAPSLHCGASLVRVATHPVATVCAALFRIPVWHACLLPKSRRRCNRTGHEKHLVNDQALCCGRRIRTFGLRVMSPTSYRCSIPRGSFYSVLGHRAALTSARSRDRFSATRRTARATSARATARAHSRPPPASSPVAPRRSTPRPEARSRSLGPG